MSIGRAFRTSPEQTIRAAQRLVATRASGGRPLVVWQGLTEPAEVFGARLCVIRQSVPAATTVIAVTPGRSAAPAPAGVTRAEIAASHFALFHPDRPSRYRTATGGRGSGKSHSVATVLVLRMLGTRLRILCAREIQKSLRESVHRLLEERIYALGLERCFDITETSILCTATASEVIFTGLYQNVSQIKSLEGIGLCWIEEAESVSARSVEILTPTIRVAGSEIWMTANPNDPTAPVMGFATNDRPGCAHAHTTYLENPWLSDELRAEAEYLRSVDDDAYRHVWLGECRANSDAQVLRGKVVVEEFSGGGPGWNGPYYGLDFGFSTDPTAAVKAWVKDRVLYVEHEAHGLGVDIDRTPALLDMIPGAREYTMRADCSRPETISYLQKNGYWRCVGVEKWKGSVEDGVAHLRQYERIVIHPRCRHTIEEARLYSYKVDRLSGDVLAEVADKHNHCMDALRYALAPLIRNNRTGMLDYIAQIKAKAGEA